jgi:DNA polymerase III subunit gamma/tau
MTDSLFDIDEVHTESGGPEPGANQPAIVAGRQSLSLYRKYRPQSFASDELFGQDHIVHTLRNAIRLNRIGHAYLFCGPRGTGKTTTARILAKAVNCLDPDPANRPCNTCEACRAINANATTDVIEIDAASNRGIDDIRELRERVKYAPTSLRTKFYIIDEAHQITGAAANAFLKTLEEPPEHTRFVLATTDPEELLQTIVSRCQRFDFRRIGIDAMSARLRQVAGSEGIAIEDDAITSIARHATGSLRDALGLLDQISVYRESADAESQAVDVDLIRTVLGVSRNDRVEGLVRAVADRDPGAGLTIINEAVEAGDDIRQLGRQLLGYLRLLMLERASGSPDADDIARELAARFELSEIARIATIFADIDYKSRHAAIVQLPIELALVEASSPPTPVPQQATPEVRPVPAAAAPEPASPQPRARTGPSLRDRVRGATMARDGSSASVPVSTPTGPDREENGDEPALRQESEPHEQGGHTDNASIGLHPASDDLERVVERWDNIRMDVKALNRRMEALLQQADPQYVEGSQLTLVAAYPFHQKRLNEDDTRRIIEEVIERQVGKKLTVVCVSRDEAQANRARTSPPSRPPDPPATAGGPVSTPRERNEDAGSSSGRIAEEDVEPSPAPPPVTPPNPYDDAVMEDIRTTPSAVSSLEIDEERIKAAINIFDAVIIEEE